jgi:hypothetical protein
VADLLKPQKGDHHAHHKPYILTPIVLKTEPDAACDLHAEGVDRRFAIASRYAKIACCAAPPPHGDGRNQLTYVRERPADLRKLERSRFHSAPWR